MGIKPGRFDYVSKQFHANRFKKKRDSLRHIDTM